MSSPIKVLFQDNKHSSIIKDRFLGFLIWQSILSTAIYTLSKTLLLSLFTPQNPFKPSLVGIFSFILFQFSSILFSISLFIISSPHTVRAASPFELSLTVLRLVLVPGNHPLSSNFRQRAGVSLSFVLFLLVSAVSGFLSVISLCWCDTVWPAQLLFGKIGFRGFTVGIFYGLYYIYKRRWILEFPIIQRPPFFSFKMGLPSSIGQALKFSSAGYLFSSVMACFLPSEFKGQVTMWKFICEEITVYVGSFVVFLCWEFCHLLHKVQHTKRFVFAPPKGSAAAETNPSEPLLAALEESTHGSLLQYLAYLDLCTVCELNVDTWRRAAFFEETGETYKRVMSVCLMPLQQLTSKLAENFGSSLVDNFQLTNQLCPPTDHLANVIQYELFCNFQLCAWSARIIASLTARSHKEDHFGVAQLSGSNAAAISTLLSCLLAVETLLGRKTNLQSPQYLMGPAGIKWAALGAGRRDAAAAGVLGKRRGKRLYLKAYAMADILRTSIYSIVSVFHDEMLIGAKGELLEKDWIINSKPLYGTRELLLQKLHLFLDYRAM